MQCTPLGAAPTQQMWKLLAGKRTSVLPWNALERRISISANLCANKFNKTNLGASGRTVVRFLACVAGAKRGGGGGGGEGEREIPLPFSPSSLSPTPYPFRRLLRRLCGFQPTTDYQEVLLFGRAKRATRSRAAKLSHLLSRASHDIPQMDSFLAGKPTTPKCVVLRRQLIFSQGILW